MSPEQARGGEQDARSDIYCLGALCFYGLTGRPPYDGADGFAVAYAHVFEPIPRLAGSASALAGADRLARWRRIRKTASRTSRNSSMR